MIVAKKIPPVAMTLAKNNDAIFMHFLKDKHWLFMPCYSSYTSYSCGQLVNAIIGRSRCTSKCEETDGIFINMSRVSFKQKFHSHTKVFVRNVTQNMWSSSIYHCENYVIYQMTFCQILRRRRFCVHFKVDFLSFYLLCDWFTIFIDVMF